MKKIMFGICIVLILLLPSVVAIPELKMNNNDVFESHSTSNNFPDLIIEDIYYYLHDPGSPVYIVEADIKNQGDEHAFGEITVEFSAVRSIFWIFDIGTIYDNIDSISLDDGLAPGESITIFLSVGEFGLPIFGFFKLNAGVNLDKKIDESNYNNNELTQRVFCFFSMWL